MLLLASDLVLLKWCLIFGSHFKVMKYAVGYEYNSLTLYYMFLSKFTYQELILLFAPMISGYTMSAFCGPGKSAGRSVKFRPPAWVFGVVWPILYILIGLAWIRSKHLTVSFITLLVLLNLWLLVYVCQKNKVGGVYIIFLSLLSALYIFISLDKTTKYLFAPLLVWLLFAAFLNTFEVQN